MKNIRCVLTLFIHPDGGSLFAVPVRRPPQLGSSWRPFSPVLRNPHSPRSRHFPFTNPPTPLRHYLRFLFPLSLTLIAISSSGCSTIVSAIWPCSAQGIRGTLASKIDHPESRISSFAHRAAVEWHPDARIVHRLCCVSCSGLLRDGENVAVLREKGATFPCV